MNKIFLLITVANMTLMNTSVTEYKTLQEMASDDERRSRFEVTGNKSTEMHYCITDKDGQEFTEIEKRFCRDFHKDQPWYWMQTGGIRKIDRESYRKYLNSLKIIPDSPYAYNLYTTSDGTVLEYIDTSKKDENGYFIARSWSAQHDFPNLFLVNLVKKFIEQGIDLEKAFAILSGQSFTCKTNFYSNSSNNERSEIAKLEISFGKRQYYTRTKEYDQLWIRFYPKRYRCFFFKKNLLNGNTEPGVEINNFRTPMKNFSLVLREYAERYFPLLKVEPEWYKYYGMPKEELDTLFTIVVQELKRKQNPQE